MSDMLSEILKLNHCKLEEQPVKYHLMESKVCWSAKRFLKKIKSKSHHQLYHWKQEKQPTMEKKKKHNLFCLLMFLGWQRFEKKSDLLVAKPWRTRLRWNRVYLIHLFPMQMLFWPISFPGSSIFWVVLLIR